MFGIQTSTLLDGKKFNLYNMSKNPYKDYYEAMRRDDEFSAIDASNARKRIKDLEDTASWNNCSVESLLEREWHDDMGS